MIIMFTICILEWAFTDMIKSKSQGKDVCSVEPDYRLRPNFKT